MSLRRSIPVVRSAHGLQISAALFGLMLAFAMPAYSDDKNDEYRFTIDPSYALTADHKWIGVGHLGYIKSDDNNYQTDYVGVGTIWGFAPWGEIWFDVRYYHTDNEIIADVEEWRPQVGFKNYFTKSGPFTFYNLARLEYRIREIEGADRHTESSRLRDRLGIVFALTKEQDRLGSWYGIADAEAFYRFDDEKTDRVRLRAGLGLSLSDRVRVEFSYYAQFTDLGSGGFEWTENIYRINIKLARQKGLLARLAHGEGDGDD
jgi:Protein of unknown function (DUF2490)